MLSSPAPGRWKNRACAVGELPAMKRCVVAYATRDQQWLWTVDLPLAATVEDAINAARSLAAQNPQAASGHAAGAFDVPWATAPVGIFGQPCQRSDTPREGDRIELYRPLASDPRERRRARVQSQRKAARTPGRS
jgi:putative ubiquitin-RnfH superfamily antitoxin RatB of RatAB toxin-antitoxin module